MRRITPLRLSAALMCLTTATAFFCSLGFAVFAGGSVLILWVDAASAEALISAIGATSAISFASFAWFVLGRHLYTETIVRLNKIAIHKHKPKAVQKQ